jgi:hypothetical protein
VSRFPPGTLSSPCSLCVSLCLSFSYLVLLSLLLSLRNAGAPSLTYAYTRVLRAPHACVHTRPVTGSGARCEQISLRAHVIKSTACTIKSHVLPYQERERERERGTQTPTRTHTYLTYQEQISLRAHVLSKGTNMHVHIMYV